MYELVVTLEFSDYKKGDRITDVEAIKKVLAENPHNVVKVAVPTLQ
jgi:hypothetical protein